MPDRQISDLTPDTTPDASSELELEYAGAAIKSTIPQVVNGAFGNGSQEASLHRTGLNTFEARRHNAAASAPDASNDSSEGYGVGSIWLDTRENVLWFCAQATAGNASWRELAFVDATNDRLCYFDTTDPGLTSIRSAAISLGIGKFNLEAVDFDLNGNDLIGLGSIATISGTSDTMADDDDHVIYRCTNASTVTITVPTGLTPRVTAEYMQEGAGQVRIVAGAGMNLRVPPTFNPYTEEQWASVVVTILDTDEALIRGFLEQVV